MVISYNFFQLLNAFTLMKMLACNSFKKIIDGCFYSCISYEIMCHFAKWPLWTAEANMGAVESVPNLNVRREVKVKDVTKLFAKA
jgi:hypothetical protein